MFDLKPPRHISTLPFTSVRARGGHVRSTPTDLFNADLLFRVVPQVFPTNSIADRQHHQIGMKSCRSFEHLVGAQQEG